MPVANLNTLAIEQAVEKTLEKNGIIVNEHFSQELNSYGASTDEAARQLADILMNGKEHYKLRAIEMVVKAHGIDLSPKQQTDNGITVNINVNAENAQINSLFNPERKF